MTRPTLSARFYKGHGLGNDYLVFEAGTEWVATPDAVREVCDRFRGVGSDGIVAWVGGSPEEACELRMFNPDGSEFERSGNGLRVFASHLARGGVEGEMSVRTGGQRVLMHHHGASNGAHDVSVEMGRAATGPEAVAMDSDALDGAGKVVAAELGPVRVVPVSVGNPHLVVLDEPVTEERLAELGPVLTKHPSLAAGANVQLARAAGSGLAEALVWERGVGRTAASGTSACAVAVALVLAGLLEPGPVRVTMPGGALSVTVGADLDVVLRGPVEEVHSGALTPAMLQSLAATVSPGE